MSRRIGSRIIARLERPMAKLEEVLVSVWKQALEDDARIVQVEGESVKVRLTSKRKLKQVDFRFDGSGTAWLGTES